MSNPTSIAPIENGPFQVSGAGSLKGLMDGKQHDASKTVFLCRCGGLYFVTSGFRRGSRGPLFAGGLLFGLGVYNKIDFAVFVAAAGVALLVTSPGWIRDALTDRRREVACVLVGFAAGAVPMAIGAAGALAAAGAASAAQGFGSQDWLEKLSVAGAVSSES